MKKFTIDEMHDYLNNHWYDSDNLTDFNMAIDSGYTLYAAYLIKSGGALNPDIEIEKSILKELKGYNPEFDIKECFENATVFINEKTNEHAFVKNEYVDYFVSLKDLGKDWKRS